MRNGNDDQPSHEGGGDGHARENGDAQHARDDADADGVTAQSGQQPVVQHHNAIGDQIHDDSAPDGKRRGKRKIRKTLSELLVEIAEDTSRERVSIADLVEALHLRAFGAMLLIFALPNAVPTPPGTSAILGLPLLFLTAQMMLGRTPWLPAFIARRSMGQPEFATLVGKMGPFLHRAERLLSPRLLILTRPAAERVVGTLCLILAIVLFLPIPLGNMLPAFAISVVALGILERDGLWILAGCVIGLVSLVIVWGVVLAMFKAAAFLIANIFA